MTAPDSEPGSGDFPVVWGRYEVLGVLGKGGFSTVYRAELQGPSGFRKPVALKVVTGIDRPSRAAFMAEARLGARLHHPNVVEVYDLGDLDGRPFIAMEVVDGPTLHAVLRKIGPLPVGAALNIVGQVALAAHHAHELVVDNRPLSVVHRDIKATNVLLDREGRVKLADFGIARTSDRTPIAEGAGTLGYMPPEQLQGHPTDRRADVFALGVLLAYSVLGKLPWPVKPRLKYVRRMSDPIAEIERHGGLLAVEQILRGLSDVVRRCLHASPAQRYETALALATDLERLLISAPTGLSAAELIVPMMPRADGKVTSGPRFGRRLSKDGDTVMRYRPPATNLEDARDRFVGRAAELAEVTDRLGRSARVVTLIGPGGIGKTRLAREVGLRALANWPGGVWFSDLSAVHTALGVLHEVADVIGAHLATDGDEAALVAQVGKALAARESMLLILDNFEQVVEQAGIVAEWAAQAPRVQFLVTSRERLRIGLEDPLILGPMELDDAVDLFIERGRAARPGFAPGHNDRREVEALVDALDRMPLPIELAAARLRLMGPAQLREALTNRFRVLRSDRRDLPARQATLRGAISWSWDLLQDWERAAFAQLSVFEAPFTVDAASAVLDLDRWPEAPWGLFAAEALIEKSLLRVISAADAKRPVRLGMYVALREFAAEKLEESGQLACAQTRHGEWYISSVSKAQRAPLELADLVAATHRALDRGDLPVAASAAAEAVGVVIQTGPFEVGLALATRVLASTELQDVDRLRVLLARAELWTHARGCGGIQEEVDQAQHLAFTLDLPGPITKALTLQSRIAHGHHRHDDAWVLLELALRSAQRSGAPQLAAARVQNRMVHVAIAQGQLDKAREVGEKARETFERAGDEREQAAVLGVLAVVAVHEGRWTDADKLLSRAIIIEEEIGDQRAAMLHQANISHVFRMQGRVDEAEQMLRRIIPKQLALGDTRTALVSLVTYAVVLRNLGRLDQALEVYTRALEEVGGDRERRAGILGNMASVYGDRGNYTQAAHLVRKSLELFRAVDSKRFVRVACLNLAEVLLELGDIEDAEAAIDEAVALGEAHGLLESKAASYGLRAIIKAKAGDAHAAHKNLQLATELGSESVLEEASLASYRGRVALVLADGETLDEVLALLDELVASAAARPGSRLANFAKDLRREIAAGEGASGELGASRNPSPPASTD